MPSAGRIKTECAATGTSSSAAHSPQLDPQMTCQGPSIDPSDREAPEVATSGRRPKVVLVRRTSPVRLAPLVAAPRSRAASAFEHSEFVYPLSASVLLLPLCNERVMTRPHRDARVVVAIDDPRERGARPGV